MGLVVFMYLICSLRTNVVFFCIFLFLDIAFFLLSGAYWKAAQGDMEAFHKLEVVRIIGFTPAESQLEHKC